MEKNYSFAVEDVQKISLDDYDDDEFAIARLGFLSNRPNSHQLRISKEVLMEYASTFLNKWLVADMSSVVDAGTHTAKEHIVGRIPKEQTVEFVEDKDGYTRAYVDAVVSKIYAKDFCAIFENNNKRSVSVEMAVTTPEEDEYDVLAFKGVGVTVLGAMYKPSCPESDVELVRFSEEDSDKFFNRVHSDKLSQLKTFAKERKQSMAESKTYKVDKSKEAMSTKAWGSVDKIALRDKIMEASNKASLVKDVYMLVEDGYEDAPSEKLKYPVMNFEGDTLVYNRDGLASALGYAKKENETAVVSKIEKIYKKLGLDKEDRKEEKMAEIKQFSQLEGREIYAEVIKRVQGKLGKNMYVEQVYSDHVVVTNEQSKEVYDIPADIRVGKDDEDMHIEIDYDKMKKSKEQVRFAEDGEQSKEEDKKDEDDDSDDDEDDDKEVEMSCDEMKAEMARMKKDIEDRDNIIMEKDTELADLRAFKQSCMEADRAKTVEGIMSSVAKFMDKADADKYRTEGMTVAFAEVDAWANKVKASVVDKVVKSETKVDFTRIGAPVEVNNKSGSVWNRL